MANPLPRIIDGHNDTLLALLHPGRGVRRDFFQRSAHGHLDLPRAREGGLGAAWFAMFIPSPGREPAPPEPTEPGAPVLYRTPPPIGRTYAQRLAVEMAALLLRLEAQAAGALKIVRTAAELRACVAPGSTTLGAVLHLEGAEPIDPEFALLDVLVAAGLRSLGLVWSRPTIFAHGVPFGFPSSPDTGPGLTDLGRALVRRCNELRVLIDLSHLNEKGFWDVAGLSRAPLVATHSCAHALCASSRNLTDAQIKAIAESGGLVGINFFTAFLRADGNPKAAHTPLSEIARHAAYIANLVGDDHVALGSDMDGADMPSDFPDVTAMPRVLQALRAAGFDEVGVQKVAQGNWLRVAEATWGS